MNYTDRFYEEQSGGSKASAAEVAPLLADLVKPRSVVDVGCGVGTWLSAFRSAGVPDALGVDGDYVPRDRLQIPADQFRPADLSKPLDLGRTFDLALSLEVGEHIPADCADVYVDSLVALAPVVVFAAAIPFQGGTDHVNEQWPSWWVEKFAERGYVVVDAVRPLIWDNDKVEPFYRQDILVFVAEGRLDRYPALRAARERTHESMISLVHPKIYVGRNSYPLAPAGHLLAWSLRLALGRARRCVRRWLGR